METIQILLIITAPLLHSLEQVLTRKPGRVRWPWLYFDTGFMELDGEHTARWLMVAVYVFYPHAVLSWGILGVSVLVFAHWWAYNLGYHILFDATPDRTWWQCCPAWEFLSEFI